MMMMMVVDGWLVNKTKVSTVCHWADRSSRHAPVS